MKILAFAASNSRHSINRDLVEYAAAQMQSDILPQAQVEFLDLNDFEMPIYSIDRETETGIPDAARVFFDKIGAADALLVSFAENNGSVTTAWKNIFDWMSRIEMKAWQGKPLVMLAATPGARAGAIVLDSQEMLAPHFGAVIRGKYGIGKWHEVWEPQTKALSRHQDIESLRNALGGLVLEPA
jgi:NAD(P)H-dependent FMN reductase